MWSAYLFDSPPVNALFPHTQRTLLPSCVRSKPHNRLTWEVDYHYEYGTSIEERTLMPSSDLIPPMLPIWWRWWWWCLWHICLARHYERSTYLCHRHSISRFWFILINAYGRVCDVMEGDTFRRMGENEIAYNLECTHLNVIVVAKAAAAEAH